MTSPTRAPGRLGPPRGMDVVAGTITLPGEAQQARPEPRTLLRWADDVQLWRAISVLLSFGGTRLLPWAGLEAVAVGTMLGFLTTLLVLRSQAELLLLQQPHALRRALAPALSVAGVLMATAASLLFG